MFQMIPHPVTQLIGLREKNTGKSHISWEHLWFPVDFPLSQPIDWFIEKLIHLQDDGIVHH